MNTLSIAVAVTATSLFAFSAEAAVIDFGADDFANTFNPDPFAPYVTTIEIGGVSFTFSAIARGTDGFRRPFDNVGLSFGVGGNGMQSLSITSDQDLIFTSIIGEDRSNLDADTVEVPFTVALDGVAQSSGHQFSSTASAWDFADVTVTAGSSFSIFEGALGDPNARSILRSLSFETVSTTSPVPLPAGLPLLLAGLAAFGVMRKRS